MPMENGHLCSKGKHEIARSLNPNCDNRKVADMCHHCAENWIYVNSTYLNVIVYPITYYNRYVYHNDTLQLNVNSKIFID